MNGIAITQPSIYEIANEKIGSTVAEHIRWRIADNAVQNPEWCAGYDNLLQHIRSTTGVLRHPESWDNLPSKVRYSGPVIVTSRHASLEEVMGTFEDEIAWLMDETGQAESIDLIASIAAAECWMAVLGCESTSYAASRGPDAIASLSAIIARACGDGVDVTPLDPSWPSCRFNMHNLMGALYTCRDWVGEVLGRECWPAVAVRITSDLGWKATGSTKTHDASLLLGVWLREHGR